MSEKLLIALTKMLRKPITGAEARTEQLHGGTLGDVKLLTDTAQTADGETLPFRLVWKTQKKWERPGDPGSWRREADLYNSDFGSLFFGDFRWPECYHTEQSEEETQLWMEYIDGVSGLALSADMYEQAALELGRFQGRLYAEQPALLRNLKNLSGTGYAKGFYEYYKSWDVVFDYIRSEHCEIPKHLCDMLIHVDDNADAIWRRVEKLPVVLCHRDFWVANIFHTDGGIRLIDWDTAGWGYLGEDIASLIADEADVPNMAEFYRRCVPAYYRGFSEHADVSHITDDCVLELILLMFGYRLVEWFLNAESPETKARHVETLQKIYEMGNVNV